jgi:hypothetical protein
MPQNSTCADLLRISEIGLAVPDVPTAAESQQNAFGLPVFGAAAAEFTPLGDPNGLLIVVQDVRPWFLPRLSRRRWALLLSRSSCLAPQSRWR